MLKVVYIIVFILSSCVMSPLPDQLNSVRLWRADQKDGSGEDLFYEIVNDLRLQERSDFIIYGNPEPGSGAFDLITLVDKRKRIFKRETLGAEETMFILDEELFERVLESEYVTSLHSSTWRVKFICAGSGESGKSSYKGICLLFEGGPFFKIR